MGHSVKGSPYFIFVPIFAYGPQNANVLSEWIPTLNLFREGACRKLLVIIVPLAKKYYKNILASEIQQKHPSLRMPRKTRSNRSRLCRDKNVLSKGPYRVVGRRYNKIINCANDLDKKNKFVHIFISFGQISCLLQVEKPIEFWL